LNPTVHEIIKYQHRRNGNFGGKQGAEGNSSKDDKLELNRSRNVLIYNWSPRPSRKYSTLKALERKVAFLPLVFYLPPHNMMEYSTFPLYDVVAPRNKLVGLHLRLGRGSQVSHGMGMGRRTAASRRYFFGKLHRLKYLWGVSFDTLTSCTYVNVNICNAWIQSCR